MTPTRLLMRAGRPPHDTTSNEAAFAWRATGHYGSNTGNMLFSDAVYTALNTPDTKITCDAYAPEWRDFTDEEADYIQQNFDAYVLPMANALRPDFAEQQLPRLTSLFNRLDMPIIIPGIGADVQSHKGSVNWNDAAKESVTAFVRSVLDHSASIGVRGEFTKQALVDLGLPADSIDVIGCPSMYMSGREFTLSTDLDGIDETARVATSLEVKLPKIAQVYRANEKRYKDLVSVYQKNAGGDLILWGQDAPSYPAGTPRSVNDAAYKEGRLRFFTNPVSWRNFMRERDFAMGIRIHGTVAALTAGTPAHLLTIDSRTEELGRQHGIPRTKYTDFVEQGNFLAEDLYERTDFSEFNRLMPENWDRYYAFLERNGLAHINQPGNENPKYAEKLAKFKPAPGIRPISADDPAGLATRFAWLRQDRAADHGRSARTFTPEFALDKTYVEAPHEGIAILAGRQRELKAVQNATIKQQEAELDSLRKRTEELEAAVAHMQRPFGAGFRDAVSRLIGRGK